MGTVHHAQYDQIGRVISQSTTISKLYWVCVEQNSQKENTHWSEEERLYKLFMYKMLAYSIFDSVENMFLDIKIRFTFLDDKEPVHTQ